MRPGIVSASALALTLAVVPAGAGGGERRSLTVLHSGDVHGWVLPWDHARSEPTDHSLAHLASLIESIRGEGRPTLLLDSGDTIQGTPFESFTLLGDGGTSPTVEAMNRIGYQAMAVGNHEFNFGLEVLRRAEAQADFPFLAANVIHEGQGTPAFATHRVFELDGVRVGVLGLVTPAVPSWERAENYAGLAFLDPTEVARAWVPRLRDDEGCDVVVVLAHTGMEEDLDSGRSNGSEAENFGVRLSEVPGIDLLLTAHSHVNIPPRQLGATVVSQPAAHGRFLTRIDLDLERRDGRWQITGWAGENLSAGRAEPDPGILDHFRSTRATVDRALDRTVGESTRAVTVAGCRLADCAALDLIHSAQLEATGADLSLASILTDHSPDLVPGPVPWRWVHGLYVYPNSLYSVRVTGAEVKDILEHAARYYDGLECDSSGHCAVLVDPDIPVYNVDSMAGVDYRIDPTRPEGDRVRDLRVDGEPLDLHRSFTLACNNYRRAGGGGYPHLADAEVVWVSSAEISSLIGAHLGDHRPWRPTADANWVIAPEMTGEKALSDGP